MKHLLQVGGFVLILLVSSSLALADHSEGYMKASAAYNTGDFEKAYLLWLVEAENDHPEAQEMLGAMYIAGKGVPKNDKEAVRWYRMAAEQGAANAQYVLGKMYSQGNGVSLSPEHACAWWMVAAANGNVAAKRERKPLHMKMTPEQTEKTYSIVIDILLKLGE
jgi:TPR repeat protein